MIKISLADQQDGLQINSELLQRAVKRIVADAGIRTATIGIAIVDDATIHRLNREFLQHDYPTDVLSFVLEQDAGHLEGEIILGAEQAVRMAREYDWPAEHELLLYAIHGTLHLVGYDDQNDASREQMRAAERTYLRHCGVTLPADGK